HAFRQTQTAYTARIYHEQGIDLLHPKLPVLGEPFEVPFEFPLFQAAASIVMDAGVDDDRAMRTTGLACFLLTALLLFGLVRHVTGRVGAIAAVAAFVFTPFAFVWGRASLMEYLATAGGVGFAWATIVWRERAHPLPGALALVAGLVGMLVKPTTALFWILPALAHRPESARETDRRRIRIGAAALIALPLVAALAWTRHADSIKQAGPTTAWLTSGALREWNFGTIEQRFDLTTWDVVLSRIGHTVLGAAGVMLLAVAIVATVSSPQRRFWASIWLAAVAPMLVFTNLYFLHDYYLAAISPALAALVGLSADFIATRLPNKPAVAAAGVVLAGFLAYTTLDLGRSYWLRIHGSEDDPTVMPLAGQISAHTRPGELVATDGLDWDPAVLYYARRWGHMVTGHTRDVAFDLIRSDDYRYLVVHDPANADLEPLGRWTLLGALDRNLYALADTRNELGNAQFVVSDVAAVPSVAQAPTEIPCGRSFSLRSRAPGTWLSFAPAGASARIAVSDEIAPLPVRRYAWLDADLAHGDRFMLTCSGMPSLTLEAVVEGAGR
ncbi:MAG TPA: glycosyltransferase family 39 protein, partial [Gaiellaceae bacterium]|nr:glycosyltransferase family 39 protein [Gaiellaceae bacterium]